MFLSRQQVRNVDRVAIEQFGFTGLQLMENAAGNAARRLLDLFPTGRFVILCGRGNNGGDGYVIARHLDLAAREIQIVSIADVDDLSPDAKANAVISQHLDLPCLRYAPNANPCVSSEFDNSNFAPNDVLNRIDIDERTVIVDCLLGTGATGSPREPSRSLVQWANRLSCHRVAIDIPTGMDCDSGEAWEPCFVADRTLTFVAMKGGFENPASVIHTGLVDVISIGVGKKILSAAGI